MKTPPPELTAAEMNELGRFNAERRRGLVHDERTADRMADLQRRFDARSVWLDAEADRLDAEVEWCRRVELPRWLAVALIVYGVVVTVVALVWRP